MNCVNSRAHMKLSSHSDLNTFALQPDAQILAAFSNDIRLWNVTRALPLSSGIELFPAWRLVAEWFGIWACFCNMAKMSKMPSPWVKVATRLPRWPGLIVV